MIAQLEQEAANTVSGFHILYNIGANLMIKHIHQLLQEVGPGKMSNLAYDTAWVARLGELDAKLSNQALNWLCENQLPDGSWGTEQPFYYHDRVISTLAAMIALTHRGRRAEDSARIKKGLLALEKITEGATQGLQTDPNGATVGFEMIVPTLVEEAEKLGIIKQQGNRILGRISQQRKAKLELLRGKKINRHITAAFSAEMAGKDGQGLLDLENLQESNGSIGHSPSATAYYLNFISPDNKSALNYLNKYTDSSGGISDLIPFDVFETSWTLWNFSLIDNWDESSKVLFQPLIDFLKRGWRSDKGIGLSMGYSIPDGDDTSIVFEVLSRFGESPDISAVLSFEESDHFRTYHYEANSSNSVNIHALGALRYANLGFDSKPVQKILNYLYKSRVMDCYWFDKWNLSPYYTTAHAIVACAGFANKLIESSIEWIVNTQKKEGGWGYQFPTAEETAYCLQALLIWQKHGGKLPKKITKNAVEWLKDYFSPPYPPLWIGKGLYTPEIVVRSSILSAILLSENG